VAMDAWALATVSDLEDRTRVRGHSDSPPPRSRRRRNSPSSSSSQSRASGQAARSTGQQAEPPVGRRMSALAWWLVATSVLVMVLAAIAVYVLIRANSSDIPTVTDIAAEERSGRIEFSWPDPGLQQGDSYEIETDDGETSLQSASSYAVDGDPGERLCITVAVNRAGVTGPSSNLKCATFQP
jgi:hypothetical protein